MTNDSAAAGPPRASPAGPAALPHLFHLDCLDAFTYVGSATGQGLLHAPRRGAAHA